MVSGKLPDCLSAAVMQPVIGDYTRYSVLLANASSGGLVSGQGYCIVCCCEPEGRSNLFFLMVGDCFASLAMTSRMFLHDEWRERTMVELAMTLRGSFGTLTGLWQSPRGLVCGLDRQCVLRYNY